MPPIGETLREARMRQRLDVADVEQRTKIRAKYLRALENEEWDSLPGPTFVKTFLRTYAEVVGVDAHLLVEEYRASHEVVEPELQPIAAGPGGRRRDPGRERRRPSAPGPPGRGVAAAVLVLAVVVLLLVLGWSADDPDDGERRAGDQTTTTTPSPGPRARRPRRRPAQPVAGVTLRIAPTVPTYACLDAGEGTEVVFEGTLERPQTFRNPRRLRLNLGKRSVEMQANGEPVEIAESPEPYGLDLTRRGAQEIVEGTRPCA